MPTTIRCSQCENVFRATAFPATCPKCGKAFRPVRLVVPPPTNGGQDTEAFSHSPTPLRRSTWMPNVSRFKNRTMILASLCGAVLVAFAIVAWFIWPTPYRYDRITLKGETHPIRIGRFTGEAEILFMDGWHSTKAEQERQAAVALTQAERSRAANEAAQIAASRWQQARWQESLRQREIADAEAAWRIVPPDQLSALVFKGRNIGHGHYLNLAIHNGSSSALTEIVIDVEMSVTTLNAAMSSEKAGLPSEKRCWKTMTCGDARYRESVAAGRSDKERAPIFSSMIAAQSEMQKHDQNLMDLGKATPFHGVYRFKPVGAASAPPVTDKNFTCETAYVPPCVLNGLSFRVISAIRARPR